MMKLEVNPAYVFSKIDQHAGVASDPNATVLPNGSTIYIYPHDRSDSWAFRVQVSPDQAVLGFPKFFQIGIGFEKEEDGNTNLPSSCTVNEIFEHIKHNKNGAPDADCLKAIRMVKVAASKWESFEQKQKDEKTLRMFPELRGPNGGIMTYTQFRKACKVAQQAYTGDYNVVFGQSQKRCFLFSLDNRKGVKGAMVNLYRFLKEIANGGDVHNYQYFGIEGANFAHSGSTPNKWTSSLLGIHNFVVLGK